MQGNDSQDANARPSGSEQELSDKLRNKIKELDKWRIYPSSIIAKDTHECYGGYATVVRATLGFISGVWSGKEVAIKKLSIKNESDRQRVLGLALREAGFLIELSHKNIIKLEGFIEDSANDLIWLIFPWEEGGNLNAFMAMRDWEIPERISLINDVATGVEYLHSRNPPICHGDLKSVNILVNWRFRAVIIDFGSARRLSHKDQAPNKETNQCENGRLPELVFGTTICTPSNTITLTGNKFTLRWAAPELLLYDEPGLWSDIWSLGWICYEVMTNSIPFKDVEMDCVVFTRVILGDLPSVSDNARVTVVQALHSLMTDCWSLDPSKRPSAEDCRNSLSQMPRMVPEGLSRTSDQAVSSDRSPRRLVAQGAIHKLQNDYTEASSHFTEALATSLAGDDEVKAFALQSLAEIHMLQKEYSNAASRYSQALEILFDKEDIGKALLGLADTLRLLGEYNRAALEYFEALDICTSTENSKGKAAALLGLAELHRMQGNRQGRADALIGLADVHRAQGTYSKAAPLYSEAVKIYTEIANHKGRADALYGLAELHRVQRNYNEAVQLYSDALKLHTETANSKGRAGALFGLTEAYQAQGNREGRANALLQLAELHRTQGNYTKAVPLYFQAMDIYTDTTNTIGRSDALIGLIETYQAQGNRKGRAEALVGLSELRDTRQGTADTLLDLADDHRAHKEYTDAVSRYSEALRIYTSIGNRRGRVATLVGLTQVYKAQDNKQGGADTLLELANVNRDQGEYEEAACEYEEAMKIYNNVDNRKGRMAALVGLTEVHTAQGSNGLRAATLLRLGDAHRECGEYSEAESRYSEALEIYTNMGSQEGRANALSKLADIYRDLGQHDKAAETLRTVRTLRVRPLLPLLPLLPVVPGRRIRERGSPMMSPVITPFPL